MGRTVHRREGGASLPLCPGLSRKGSLCTAAETEGTISSLRRRCKAGLLLVNVWEEKGAGCSRPPTPRPGCQKLDDLGGAVRLAKERRRDVAGHRKRLLALRCCSAAVSGRGGPKPSVAPQKGARPAPFLLAGARLPPAPLSLSRERRCKSLCFYGRLY